MRWAPLLLVLALVSCAGKTGTAPEATPRPPPDEWPKLEKYQHFIENPTDIVGDEAIVILPEFYADDIHLEGLGSGWIEEGGKSTWEGSGDCLLEVRSLRIQCRLLTVTLVTPTDEPEVLIQASGNASLAQQVRGIGSWYQDLMLLTIRNERMRFMQR